MAEENRTITKEEHLKLAGLFALAEPLVTKLYDIEAICCSILDEDVEDSGHIGDEIWGKGPNDLASVLEKLSVEISDG